MDGFYGFEVHAGQSAVKPAIPEGCIFRLMQVALPAGASDAITLRVSIGKQQPALVLLTLNPKKALYQCALDSVFGGKQEVSFTAEGSGAVHLTGYIQPAMDTDDDFFDDEEDEEDDLEAYGGDADHLEEEEEEEEFVPAPRGAKAGKGKRPAAHRDAGERQAESRKQPRHDGGGKKKKGRKN